MPSRAFYLRMANALYLLSTFYEKGAFPLTYWTGGICEGEMSCKLSGGLFRQLFQVSRDVVSGGMIQTHITLRSLVRYHSDLG